MTEWDYILKRMILIGGPPRSGTTIAAKILNSHPRIITAIDDHVWECWGLYHYRNRTGLVDRIRKAPDTLSKEIAHHILGDALIEGNCLKGVGPSPKTQGCSVVPFNSTGSPAAISPLNLALERHRFPLDRFSSNWFLCLKSPEISHVLPQLTEYFPTIKFILTFRPIIEVADSMYKTGQMVKVYPIFHQRWSQERGEDGKTLLPPGVPLEWGNCWHTASDFQRCVIFAASYVRAILEGTRKLTPACFHAYNHSDLLNSPSTVFRHLADFLGVEAEGFQGAMPLIRTSQSRVQPEFREEYLAIDERLGLTPLAVDVANLMNPATSRSTSSQSDSQPQGRTT